MSVDVFVQAVAGRQRTRDLAWTCSAALLVAMVVGLALTRVTAPATSAIAAIIAALVVAGGGIAWRRGAWTADAVARLTEGRVPGLDNLLVTAVSAETMAALSPAIRDEVRRQADVRLMAYRPDTLVAVGPAVGALVAMLALAGASALMWPAFTRHTLAGDARAAVAPVDGGFAVEVTVTSPAYLRAAARTWQDPSEVVVPAGGTLRLVVRAALASAVIQDATGAAVALTPETAAGTFARTWLPTASTTIAVLGRDQHGATVASRLLPVTVAPDRRPTVRVAQPGRDLRLPSADTPIDLRVEADDDHGITALELRYVRIAGSGESFTFGEGRVPLTDLTRTGSGVQARLSWALRPLALEPGESLVYRVVARDDAPGQPAGESESYTIDIGKAYETTGAGAAVAEEDRRYAISQQMVIVHTERALAERGAANDDAWLARTQGIAAEQRMVRAEVVFLGGGEVEDEVEEASRGDELQEGRLENRGRAEMLRAMGEMSRAEARLIAGDARGALVFERQALAALLKAFDRRRYFLRTVPERARIDVSRRLSGDRRTARPADRLAIEREDPVAAERALLLALAAAGSGDGVAALAARVAALVPGDAAWARLAARLIDAPDAAAQVSAVRDVAAALRARVHGRVPAAPASPGGSRDYLDGLWRGERRAGSSR